MGWEGFGKRNQESDVEVEKKGQIINEVLEDGGKGSDEVLEGGGGDALKAPTRDEADVLQIRKHYFHP